MRTILLLTLATLACNSPAPVAISRADLVLDQGWTRSSYGTTLNLATTFWVDEVPQHETATLVLDGAWWMVKARINGTILSPTTSTLSPARMNVTTLLVTGENKLELTIHPAEDEPTVLTGGKSNGVAAVLPGSLWAPPRIELRPLAHVTSAVIRDGDVDVSVAAKVENAPPGARVSFQAWLDGEIVARLGEAEVLSGAATGPAKSWRGPLWSPANGDDGLFTLVTTLTGPDGEVLDVATQRTAVRRDPATVNRRPQPILAARVVPEMDTSTVGRYLAMSGTNAAEWHGQIPTDAYLSTMDEVGMPVIVMPYCAGRLGFQVSNGQFEAQLAEYEDRIAVQFSGMLDTLGPHPSLSAWALEGDPNIVESFAAYLRRDERRRLVLGADVPGIVIMDGGEDPTLRYRPDAWLVEVAHNPAYPDTLAPDDLMPIAGQAFVGLINVGHGVGGVMWQPGIHETSLPPRETMAEPLREAARQTNAPQVEPGPRRGSSLVKVTGAAPGHTVWLSVPMQATIGAVADSHGTATLSAWHEGPATIRAGGRTFPIELQPTTWIDYMRAGDPALLDLSTAVELSPAATP